MSTTITPRRMETYPSRAEFNYYDQLHITVDFLNCDGNLAFNSLRPKDMDLRQFLMFTRHVYNLGFEAASQAHTKATYDAMQGAIGEVLSSALK